MPRIVIFTQNTMASTVATRQIILKNHDKVSAIVLASQLRGDSVLVQVRLALKMIRKSSWSFAFYKIVESSGYNALLKFHKLFNSKKYIAGTAASIADLARRYNIKLLETGDLSDPALIDEIKQMNPDYIFCIVGQILKKNVFETLGNKLLNAHGSYLPEYRGAAQYFWYLLDGHTNFGVSLHYMNAGLDTGDIILQNRFPFHRPISAYGLHYRLGTEFGATFNLFLDRFGNATVVPTTAQDDTQATFTRMPTSNDVSNFWKAGYHLMGLREFLTLS